VSRRYEFLDAAAAVLVTDPEELADVFDGDVFDGYVIDGYVALVIGNPYDCAGVLHGSRQGIAATLRRLLALVEMDTSPPAV